MKTTQHSTAQHSTAQHSTAQHSTAQHSTAQHSTAQHSTAQHSGVTEGPEFDRPRIDRPRISACIITLNEANNIAGCLASLDFCDEIVVVDSFSTDATVEIAKAAGACVIQREFTGYRSQKDFCVQQARYDWILFLDADERLDDTLRQSILRARDQGFTNAAGYRFACINHCYGKFLLHKGKAAHLLRLFDRRCGGFGGHGREVHEGVSVNGPVRRLEGRLLDYTYNHGTVRFFTKRVQYAYLQVEHDCAMGKRATPGRMLWKLFVDPAWFFFYHFILKGGFRDGWAGLMHFMAECNERRLRIMMLWLRQQGLP